VFEKRIALLEGGIAALSVASGQAAQFIALICFGSYPFIQFVFSCKISIQISAFLAINIAALSIYLYAITNGRIVIKNEIY
jgi:hypothetical protein